MFTGPKQVTTLSHACLARRAPAPTPWPCAHPHAPPLVPRPRLTLCSWRGHICAAASLASAVTACSEPLWPVPTRLHPRAHSSPHPPARRTSAPRPGRSPSSAALALALSLHPSLWPLLPLLLTSCPSLSPARPPPLLVRANPSCCAAGRTPGSPGTEDLPVEGLASGSVWTHEAGGPRPPWPWPWWWWRRFPCSLAGSSPRGLWLWCPREVLALSYRALFFLCRRRALTPPTRS